MKEKFKKFGLLSLIALLYLSNTGLIYTVHTCIHTGYSVIELPQILSHEDKNCPPADNDTACSDSDEECCEETAEKTKSCHTHTTEYKKPDIVSVKPEIKVSPIIDYTQSADIAALFNIVLPSIREEHSDFDHYLLISKDSRARTSLQQRVVLSSFIC